MDIRFKVDAEEGAEGVWESEITMHVINPPASGPGWAHGEFDAGSLPILTHRGSTKQEAMTKALYSFQQALLAAFAAGAR